MTKQGYFDAGKSPGNNELTAHELTHVVQQTGGVQTKFKPFKPTSQQDRQPETERAMMIPQGGIGQALQLSCDPSVASCSPELTTNPSTGTDQSSQSTQSPDEARQTYQTARDQLLEQGPDCNLQSSVFTQYCRACETLSSYGEVLSDEPEGVLVPGDRMLVVDESGQVQLLAGNDVVEVGEDLFPVLDDVANASQSGQLPGAAMGGSLEQVLLWSDGRAVITPPASADLASLLIQGQPADLESAVSVGSLGKPWERVRDASVHSLLTSGLYQLGSHPISRFNGVQLPAGSRIKFADVGRLMQGQMETRLITVFKPGTKKFYGWDAHLPVGNTPHAYWHVNQKGMSAGLFGQSDHLTSCTFSIRVGGHCPSNEIIGFLGCDFRNKMLVQDMSHAAMTAAQIAQARNLRYIRVGGRVLFVAGRQTVLEFIGYDTEWYPEFLFVSLQELEDWDKHYLIQWSRKQELWRYPCRLIPRYADRVLAFYDGWIYLAVIPDVASTIIEIVEGLAYRWNLPIIEGPQEWSWVV